VLFARGYLLLRSGRHLRGAFTTPLGA